jgi:hypothetical protein
MKNNKNNKSSGPTRQDRQRNDALNKSEKSSEEKKLPGEYPPQEDIMNRQNMQRVGLDVENFARGIGIENYNKAGEPIVTTPNSILNEPDPSRIDDVEQTEPKEMTGPVPKDLKVDEDFARGNESDVTDEDLQALGPKDLSMDMGEDEELLKNRVWPVDMAGEDLDVPGAPDNDEKRRDQAIGAEDEENDFYSLGGDRHEDNLEGK